MADRSTTRTTAPSARPGVVWEAVVEVLAASGSAPPLDVVDVGGGTGNVAVPLAALGHRVTVVDPSPDALASLERRAREAGVTVRGVQGDAAGLLDVVPPGGADLVLFHGVLEHVDDVAAALTPLAAALRPGGTLSLLAPNRTAAVLARAVAGHLTEARAALDDPAGRWGAGDPVPRRFTEDELVGLLTDAGLRVRARHGVRVFTDLVPHADADPASRTALHELEVAAADRPEFRAVATLLHLLAERP